jgi:hypothetical protein
MGTDRKLNKMSKTRPRKSNSQRRHRLKAQRRRLVDLGMNREEVDRLTAKDVRELLKRPKEVEKKYKVSA